MQICQTRWTDTRPRFFPNFFFRRLFCQKAGLIVVIDGPAGSIGSKESGHAKFRNMGLPLAGLKTKSALVIQNPRQLIPSIIPTIKIAMKFDCVLSSFGSSDSRESFLLRAISFTSAHILFFTHQPKPIQYAMNHWKNTHDNSVHHSFAGFGYLHLIPRT